MKKQYENIDVNKLDYSVDEITSALDTFYNGIYSNVLDSYGKIEGITLLYIHEEVELVGEEYLITYFVKEYEDGNITASELKELAKENNLLDVLKKFSNSEIDIWDTKDFFYNVLLKEEQFIQDLDIKEFCETYIGKNETEILKEYFDYPYSGFVVVPETEKIASVVY